MFLQQNRNGVKIQYENNLSTQKKKISNPSNKIQQKRAKPQIRFK